MQIDRDRQAQALAKAKAIIADAEKKREAARVEKGVQLFLQGKFDILLNEEFVENLASIVLNKYITDEKQQAIDLLEKLGISLCSDTVNLRERSLMVLSVFTEIILEEDFEEFREVLSRILVDWLKFETEYIAGFEFVCSQLQKIILRMLYSGQWYVLENLIIILYQIGSGVIVKSNLIRGMAAKVHENLAEPDILDKLVTVYLEEGDERRAVAESLLIHLGRFSAMFLVQKMIYSNNKEERFALIGLIPRVGEVSVPVLRECLEEEPPWFVIRNVVLIISRLGDPSLYSVVEPYLTHQDIRVQQQVVNCIDMLGGKQMRKRLIQAMMEINDELKGQLIIQLGQFEGMDVGNAFLDLLEKRESFARHVQDDLTLKLCNKIKYYPLPRAIDCLQILMSERKERYGNADRIVLAASTSLQAIEIKIKKDGPEEAPALIDASEENIEETISEEPSLSLLNDDQAEETLEELFSMEEIEGLTTAAGLDEPFTGTVPETKQSAGEEMPFYASQDHHLMVWSNLYEQMNTDEMNELFAILKPFTFKANDEIVHQGDDVTDLYLIDSGFAGISHIDGETEVLLTSLQAGEMIGSDGFFHELKWSVSFRAQTDLQVRVLELEKLSELVEMLPELSGKLRSYCNHFDVVPYLINISDDTAHEPLEKDIAVDSNSLLLDSSGALLSEVVTGSLMYILRGGYCFTLPYPHEDNAETILGRQVSSEIQLGDDSTRKCFGVIAGAGSHDHHDQELFVYVKFYHPLEIENYSCNSLEVM